MRVLITGDSDAGALSRGKKLLQESGFSRVVSGVAIRPLGNGKNLRTPFFNDRVEYAEIADESYRQEVKRFPPEKHEYEWIGFCGPLHTSMVWRNRDWVHFAPWNMGRREHAISASLLHQVIEDDVRYSLGFIDVIRRTTPVFVIEPPWPFRHHPAISRTGPELVHFLHEQCRRHVLSELERRNVPVVTIDPAWVDAEGFMLDRFRHENPNDTHHGNAEFGLLMLERMISFLGEEYKSTKFPELIPADL